MDTATTFSALLTALRLLLRYQLYYRVPMAAMILVVLYCILGRTWIVRRVGDTVCGFLRGLLLAGLVVTALLAAGNYLSMGNLRYGSYLNAYEFYHYYMGSKYAPEIGYNELYNASLIADEETGLKFSDPKKHIRDLSTGRYRPVTSVLNESEKQRVKSLFTGKRWEEWVGDIRWFKSKLTTGRWNGILRDKGYNASPVWSTVVGGGLSNQVSTESLWGMQLLSWLDLFMIGAAFLCVLWAFGPRPALLMIVVLGTGYMMKFSHMKGAYLRTDFCMTLVIAICMLKKNHYKIAGAVTGYSILARVFPAVFLFGLGAKLFWELVKMARAALDAVWGRYTRGGNPWVYLGLILLPLVLVAAILVWVIARLPAERLASLPIAWPAPWYAYVFVCFPVALGGLVLAAGGIWGLKTRRLNMRYLQFFVTCVVTIAILVFGSIVYFGGVEIWKEYGAKIGRHNQDISPWRVGFKYVFIGRFDRGFDLSASTKEVLEHTGDALLGRTETKDPRKRTTYKTLLKKWSTHTQSSIYRENQTLWWTIQVAVLLFALFAIRRLDDHTAMAFSFVPCFFLVAPTYYYYIMILVPLLFFTPQLERPSRAVGILWLLFIGMAGYYYYSMWTQKAPTYCWLSWMVMLAVLYMMMLAAFEGRSRLQGAAITAAAALAGLYFYFVWPPNEPSQTLLSMMKWVVVALGAVLVAAEVLGLYRKPAPAMAGGAGADSAVDETHEADETDAKVEAEEPEELEAPEEPEATEGDAPAPEEPPEENDA